MKRKQSPDLISWRKDNPTLTEVVNYFRKIDDGEGLFCVFFGPFLDLEDGQTYQFPGAVYVDEIDPMEGTLAIYLPDCNARWWVQPIEPFTFEVIVDDKRLSLKIYNIGEQEWPPHIKQWHEEFANELPLSDDKPEALTRKELIDPALDERGWTDEMINREWTFTSEVDERRRRVDYVLSVLDENRRHYQPIAFIEAKHSGLIADYGLEPIRITQRRGKR